MGSPRQSNPGNQQRIYTESGGGGAAEHKSQERIFYKEMVKNVRRGRAGIPKNQQLSVVRYNEVAAAGSAVLRAWRRQTGGRKRRGRWLAGRSGG